MVIAFTATDLGVAQGIQQNLHKQQAAGYAQDKKRFRSRKSGIDGKIRNRGKAIDDLLKDKFK
jgi:hypothetical protein